jgi:LytR cell envelope-related transcriptional attenuator
LPDIVQEIGAYAGLASVVGLAVLSALYFSQARDVKRLREWAGRAPERAEQGAPAVPGRIVAQPQRPAAPAATGGARPGPPAVPGTRPAAPGVPRPPAPGLPGVTAAGTRPAAASAAGARPATATAQGPATETPESESVTTGDEHANGPRPATEEHAAPGKADAPAQAPAAPGDAPSAAPGAPAGGPPVPAGGRAGAGAAAAAAASSNSQGATKVPGVNAGSRPAAPPVPGGRPPTRPGGPGQGVPQQTAVIAPPRPEPWYRRLVANPLYLVLVIAGVLIVGGAGAFGVTQLVGDDEGGETAQGPREVAEERNGGGGEQGERPRRRGGAAVNPANVTVAVLNGTTVPGLAASIMDQAEAAGFREGTVADFLPNQQLGESVVQYMPGHERDAAAVSRRLGIAQREAVNPSSEELAGDATVVVLVGADKAP